MYTIHIYVKYLSFEIWKICPGLYSFVGLSKSPMSSVSKDQNYVFKVLRNLQETFVSGRDFAFDFFNFRAVAAALNMLIHCGIVVQGIAMY